MPEEKLLTPFRSGGCLVIGEELTGRYPVFTGNGSSPVPDNPDEPPLDQATLLRLAKIPWDVVINLGRNQVFERVLREYYQSRPFSWNVAVMAEAHHALIPRQRMPIYKLLGSFAQPEETNLVIDRSSYLKRRRRYRKILADFPDRLRANPILFIGVRQQAELVVDLLNELLEILPATGRGKGIFLINDELGNSNQVLSSLTDECSLTFLKLTLSEVVARLPSGLEIRKVTRDVKKLPLRSFRNSLVEAVPLANELEDVRTERIPLYRDALCSPDLIDWRPFKADLDWGRPTSKNLETSIQQSFIALMRQPKVFAVQGKSGVGKTTILKRSAYNLAQQGMLVFWLNHQIYADLSDFRDLCTRLAAGSGKAAEKVLIFYDGVAEGSLYASELVSELQATGADWILILGIRSLDAYGSLAKIDTHFDERFEVPDTLTDQEIASFRDYLRTNGYNVDNQNSILDSRSARDILCLFWVYKPDTQRSLRESITKEYHKLAEPDAVARAISKEIARRDHRLQLAYEATAVAARYNLPLTASILVHATDFSWEEWQGVVLDTNHPVWSLIYAENFWDRDSQEFDVIYRARNAIVTKVVVQLVNGGVTGHSGEFRVLKQLVMACDGSLPQYAGFLYCLLISRMEELRKLIPEEQHDLWKTAKSTYPYWDRALQHHYGRFLKNVMEDLPQSYYEIRKALDIPDNPTTSRKESKGNIENTLAANLVAQCASGLIPPEEAAKRVDGHVINARRFDHFSPHSAHIQGRAFIQLAESCWMTAPEESMKCINRAYNLINEAFLWMGGREKDSHLAELERNLFDRYVIVSDKSAEEAADELFEKKRSQTGFVFVARLRLEQAMAGEKGGQLKNVYDYIQGCYARVLHSGLDISPDFRRLKAELLINWKYFLRRPPFFWKEIEEELSALLVQSRQFVDPFAIFSCAIARFHLGNIKSAENLMATLDRENFFSPTRKNLIIGFALDAKGQEQFYTGTLREVGRNTFVECLELATSLRTFRNEFRANPGGTVSFKVGFTTGGFVAYDERTSVPRGSPYRNVSHG